MCFILLFTTAKYLKTEDMLGVGGRIEVLIHFLLYCSTKLRLEKKLGQVYGTRDQNIDSYFGIVENFGFRILEGADDWLSTIDTVYP